MTDLSSRRPLTSRNARWAKALAARLAAKDITPNQISQASVVCAALGFLCFWIAAVLGSGFGSFFLIIAALSIQARLLCNLFDGMVAIEGGKHAPTGAFWNEAPDRLADVLFLFGAGIAAGAPSLGLAAAAAAIATAYLRELGRAEGMPPDFCGPMAKPHRMAVLTLGCLIAALQPFGYVAAEVMAAVLWLILIGTVITIARRSRNLLNALQIRE